MDDLEGGHLMYWWSIWENISQLFDIAAYCMGPEGDLVATKGSFESAAGYIL
jgi:hypothetical protein